MPRRTDISSVLVIGSGPIVIGQACEFDYSGTQACRVLREEGLRCLEVPAFSVQFHPEAAAGPHDAEPLFQRFVDLMTASKEGSAVSPAPIVETSTGEKN